MWLFAEIIRRLRVRAERRRIRKRLRSVSERRPYPHLSRRLMRALASVRRPAAVSRRT